MKSCVCDFLREEISKGCGFYFAKTMFALISQKYDSPEKWKDVVKDSLLEVYGANLINFSATGKGTTRPGINSKLFNGLLGKYKVSN